MSEVDKRIKRQELLKRVVGADEAISIIKSGMTIGLCTDALPICDALERRAKGDRDFSINLWSASTTLKADRTFGKLGMIKRRIGQQTMLRKFINAGEVEYIDAPLGFYYQSIRSGEYGSMDVAIVEAIGVTEEGNLIPSYRCGDMPNYVQSARQVIVQLNTFYPLELEGIYDIYLPQAPPYKRVIPINKVDDRIGVPYVPIDPEKIKAIVITDIVDPIEINDSIDENSERIGKNLIAFLKNEVSRGRLPANLLPIEIGLGSIPAATLNELSNSDFKNLEFYSAILNDRVLDLIDQGKVRIASGAGLLLSPQGEQKFINKMEYYKKHIILRPVEIADCPEIVMRLGLLALNGAIEVDIYGHANSSHIMDGDIISGIGGASDFALNAFLSVILLPSVAKGGDISSIVPMVSHVDLPEHGVNVVVTEQGLADLRGLSPKERAGRIIDCCAHPAYRPLLRDYFERAKKHGGGHEPHLLGEAFSFHQRFKSTGSMKKAKD